MAYVDGLELKYENAWAAIADGFALQERKPDGSTNNTELAQYYATMAIAAEEHERNRLLEEQNGIIKELRDHMVGVFTLMTAPRTIHDSEMIIGEDPDPRGETTSP